ncbi:MAG: hypothetical protein LBO80_07380 [Treponema sp.]|jgi:hypothetical protein|nr:hypothetical protein [Treponema sp.]
MQKTPIAFFCVLLLSALFSGFLGAQTASELDAILDTPAVSNEQAARFVLAAADVLPVDVSGTDAFLYARGNNWFPPEAEPRGTITLGRLSHLIMQAFRLRGGFLYAVFPGPRYGYRALVRRELIQGFADPALRVSGERFLHILGRVLDYTLRIQEAGTEPANLAGGKP